MAESGQRKRLVFVGGGHAHVHSLQRVKALTAAGADVTLIAPDQHHYYSGMGPGLLSRIYLPEQTRIDVRNLATAGGGRFIEGKVTRIDAENRRLTLDTGDEIDYDIVSFNIGSGVPMDIIDGACDHAIPVKPIENVDLARKRILNHKKTQSTRCRILVIGGGPAGIEIAGNLWRLVNAHSVDAEIILAQSHSRLLPGFPERASEKADGSLRGRGVTLLTGSRVESIAEKRAALSNGRDLDIDISVLATGIVPNTLFRENDLAVADDGGLLINPYLQSVDHPEMFAVGDCATLKDNPLPRVGVYAVRQGPILYQNLTALLSNQPLTPFQPQKRYLLILNMGDNRGLLVWKRWVIHGRLAFIFKNYLDTSFMKQAVVPEL